MSALVKNGVEGFLDTRVNSDQQACVCQDCDNESISNVSSLAAVAMD